MSSIQFFKILMSLTFVCTLSATLKAAGDEIIDIPREYRDGTYHLMRKQDQVFVNKVMPDGSYVFTGRVSLSNGIYSFGTHHNALAISFDGITFRDLASGTSFNFGAYYCNDLYRNNRNPSLATKDANNQLFSSTNQLSQIELYPKTWCSEIFIDAENIFEGRIGTHIMILLASVKLLSLTEKRTLTCCACNECQFTSNDKDDPDHDRSSLGAFKSAFNPSISVLPSNTAIN